MFAFSSVVEDSYRINVKLLIKTIMEFSVLKLIELRRYEQAFE
jgi:hypothetical protein